jgi:DNA-binding transcriptional LysR family regulator
MSLETWDEIRTAYHVARMGTVSGAAEMLGVHHATVIRHVDALEGRLGVKLFQRHARGYTATEAGLDLLQVAQATDDQFAQLVSRIKGRGDEVTGELVVTSLAAISPLISPVLARFQQENPGLVVRFVTGEKVLRLEYGEAHVAVRAGNRPDQPDNVVQPFHQLRIGLYANRDYLARRGRPATDAELAAHDFVGWDDPGSRAPAAIWMRAHLPPSVNVYRCTEGFPMRDAVISGAGLGFLSACEASRHPELVEVMPARDEWSAPLWLVTHVDLHRTTKVQAFLAALKEEAKGW